MEKMVGQTIGGTTLHAVERGRFPGRIVLLCTGRTTDGEILGVLGVPGSISGIPPVLTCKVCLKKEAK